MLSGSIKHESHKFPVPLRSAAHLSSRLPGPEQPSAGTTVGEELAQANRQVIDHRLEQPRQGAKGSITTASGRSTSDTQPETEYRHRAAWMVTRGDLLSCYPPTEPWQCGSVKQKVYWIKKLRQVYPGV